MANKTIRLSKTISNESTLAELSAIRARLQEIITADNRNYSQGGDFLVATEHSSLFQAADMLATVENSMVKRI